MGNPLRRDFQPFDLWRATGDSESFVHYDVTVLGIATGSLVAALEDLESWLGTDATLHVAAPDQAALVAIVNRLHDLGVTITAVHRTEDNPRGSR